MKVKELRTYLDMFDEEMEIKIRIKGTNTSSTSLVNPENFSVEEGKGSGCDNLAIIDTSMSPSI